MNRAIHEESAATLATAVTETSVVILPIGAVEQHGPHLPFATDLIAVDAFADAVVAEFGERLDLWRLPAIPFSVSTEHAWAAGTVWISPETFLATMRDIGQSLSTLATRKLALLNGHGGNTSLLDVACRELRRHFGFETFLLHAMLPADHGGLGAPEELGLGIHGGMSETSVMLHVRPDLVDMSLAVDNVPRWLAEHDHVGFGKSAAFGWLANDFGPSGVIGDATLASSDLGKRLFEAGVAMLGATLADVTTFAFPPKDDPP